MHRRHSVASKSSQSQSSGTASSGSTKSSNSSSNQRHDSTGNGGKAKPTHATGDEKAINDELEKSRAELKRVPPIFPMPLIMVCRLLLLL